MTYAGYERDAIKQNQRVELLEMKVGVVLVIMGS
jgi:hypothetical protein